MATNHIELTVTPINSDYDPGDDRWLDQVTELVSDLQRGVGEVHQERTIVEGRKGGIVEIIVALGTSGAIVAAVDLFKAWLARDQNRELAISVQTGEETKVIRVSGKQMNMDDVRDLMAEALEAHAEWQS